MSFRSLLPLRCILGAWLIAVWPAHGSDLRVVCEVGGRTLALASADATRILLQDADGLVSAPAGATWRLEGEFRSVLGSFDWLTDYTVRRSQKRDADFDPGRPVEVEGNLIHKRSIDLAGKLKESPILRLWPAGLDGPVAVVFVWLVGNDVAHVEVRPLPKPEDYLHFMVRAEHAFRREQAAQCRLGLAVFSQGRFLPSVPAFPDPAAQRAIEAFVLDDVTLLKAALADGADPRAAGRDGRPLFFAAVLLGAVDACEALLQLDPALAKIVEPASGETPLHIATYYDRNPIAEKLLAAGADPDPKKNRTLTPMWIAAHYGHADLVRILLRHGVSARETPRGTLAPLFTAIEGGDGETAEALWRAGAIESTMPTPLVEAASRGKSEMVRWIIGRNQPETVRLGGNSAVYFAAEEHGDADIIRALVSAGAPVDAHDQHGNHALHAAVKRGDLAIALELLAQNAGVDLPDAKGQTALQLAALFNRPEFVSLLLDHHADPAAANGAQLQPLELALLNGAARAANALAERRVGIDPHRPLAGKCLSAAIRMDLSAVLRNALDSGWAPASEIEPGWPALRIAQVCGAAQVTSLLTAAGASGPGEDAVTVSSAAKLDAPIKILRSTMPETPRDPVGRLAPTELTIDLLVDQDGRVRFPRLRGESDGLDLRHVFAAMETWEFAPPKQSGRAVITTVAVPLRFKTERKVALLAADELPLLVRRVEPVYTGAILKSRARSTALLWAVVSSTGSIVEVEVLRETGPKIGPAAAAAVRQWIFTPAKSKGQAVSVGLEIPFIREP